MKIDYDGRVYDYGEEDITVLQALKIEAHIDGTLADYSSGLAELRAACYQCLGWILFTGADLDKPISEIDFPVLKLARPYLQALISLTAELGAAVDAIADEADPTKRPALPPSGPGTDASSPVKPSPASPRPSSPPE